MKGLIKNDWYVFGKSYALALPMVFVFSALIIIFSETDELLFTFPCIYGSMILSFISASLYSYDKRSGWNKYNAVMPYRRRDYVTVKYLFGLAASLLYILFISCITLVKVNTCEWLGFDDYFFMLFIMVLCSLGPVAMIMPISLKHSPQAGFITFGISCLVIGFLLGLFSGFLDGFLEDDPESLYSGSGGFIVFAAAALISVILYVISWFRSIRLYEKADL